MNIFQTMSIIEQMYQKILLIDIVEDSFQEIKVNEIDIPTSRKLSEWWKNYAKEKIYPDDIEKFLNFFYEIKDGASIAYRRKIEGTEQDWEWAYIEILPYQDRFHLLLVRTAHAAERLSEITNLFYDNFTDSLTRTKNLRSYEITLANLHFPSWVIYIEIQNLRYYYDVQGFTAVERCLLAAAEAMRKCFNSEEIYRFADNEFVIISQKTSDIVAGLFSCLRLELFEAGVGSALGYAHYKADGDRLCDAVARAKERMIEDREKSPKVMRMYKMAQIPQLGDHD